MRRKGKIRRERGAGKVISTKKKRKKQKKGSQGRERGAGKEDKCNEEKEKKKNRKGERGARVKKREQEK